jgi:DNA-binding response OmpR family regulator
MKEDRIKGFHLGCDDYIIKPFSTEELSLRIQAILKRCGNQQKASARDEEPVFNIGRYIFDHKNMILRLDEEERVLTRKENALLKLLYENRNNLLQKLP